MRLIKWLRRHENVIWACVFVAALMTILAVAFDYYYELNDDVLMKDILAGVYTGKPESHNIQMLWLIGVFISLLYRIFPQAPCYGVFLCFCQFGCIFLLLYRMMRFCKSKKAKLMIGISLSMAAGGLLLEHLVFVQYSITVACLAAVAAFLFMTIPEDLTKRKFALQAGCCVAIVFVAFLIRTEMLLLLLPFICVAGFFRWMQEKQPFHKENLYRYVGTIAAIGVVLCVGLGSNRLAYNQPGWQKFQELFDQRTELYDFQYIPDYEENKDFYVSQGLSREQVMLLTNYNYGLDNRIDEHTLQCVAEYAASIRPEDLHQVLTQGIREYLYRLLHFTDAPYSSIVFLLYLMYILALMLQKGKTLTARIYSVVWHVGMLVGVRSALWLFILCRRRAPDRITHSLYLVELVILLAALAKEWSHEIRDKQFVVLLCLVLLTGLMVFWIPGQVEKVDARVTYQNKINVYDEALRNYCKDHPENFYFEDVYSSIYEGNAFNQKMFVDVDNSFLNCDLLGGWFYGSPLQQKKAATYGISSISDALRERQDVLFVCEKGDSLDWLFAFYETIDKPIQVEQVDLVEELFVIYQISPAVGK